MISPLSSYPLRIVLAFVMAIVLFLAIGLPTRLEIIGPRLGIPAIRTPGQTVEIMLRASWPVIRPDWQVTLHADDGSQHPVDVVESDHWLPAKTLEIRLPDDLPPAAYDLQVVTGAASRTMPNAVHVLAHIPERFTIVHIADLPVFGKPDGSGEAMMRTLVDEINLVNPSLVIASGDIAYGSSYANYQTLYDFFLDLTAPVIVGPGNHEFEAWNGYLDFFRQRYHALPFGPWLMVTLDSSHRRDQMTYSQLAWFKETMAAQGQEPTLVNLHHPLFENRGLQVNVEEIMAILSQHGVELVLSGHNHGDRLFDNTGQRRLDTWELPGPLNIVTTSAGARIYPKQSDSPLHHGYRLIHIAGAEILNFTYDYDGDGRRDPSASIPTGHLTVDRPDEGTVVVNNGLYESFANARVVIQSPQSGLVPSLGELVVERQSQNAGQTEGEGEVQRDYLVEFPLPAQGSVQIRLVAPDASATPALEAGDDA